MNYTFKNQAMNETLGELLEAVVNMSNNNAEQTADTETRAAYMLGRQIAFMSVLADKIAGLWLWGCDTYRDSEAIKEAAHVILTNAEKWAKAADMSITNIMADYDRVIKWANDKTNHTEEKEATASEDSDNEGESVQNTTTTEEAAQIEEVEEENTTDNEQDNTPTNGGQTATESENEPQSEHRANNVNKLANVVKVVARRTAQAVVLGACVVLSFAVLVGTLSVASHVIRTIGLEPGTWCSVCAVLVLACTVCLDLTVWAESWMLKAVSPMFDEMRGIKPLAFPRSVIGMICRA